MKIAICVSGSLRKYKTCLPYFNKYIIDDLTKKGYEVDVFLHVWKFKNNPKNLKHNFKWYEDIEEFKDDEIIALYKPKKYVIEEFTDKRMEEIIKSQGGEFVLEKTKSLNNLDPNTKVGINERRLVNMYGMYYKIYACNQLRKEYAAINGTYDVVVRTRPDLIYQCSFDKYEEDLFEKIVKGDMLVYMTCRSGVCDHLFLGSGSSMDKVCDIFNRLTGIFKKKSVVTSEKVLVKCTRGMNIKEYNKCYNKNKYSIHHIIERLFQKAPEYRDLPRLE